MDVCVGAQGKKSRFFKGCGVNYSPPAFLGRQCQSLQAPGVESRGLGRPRRPVRACTGRQRPVQESTHTGALPLRPNRGQARLPGPDSTSPHELSAVRFARSRGLVGVSGEHAVECLGRLSDVLLSIRWAASPSVSPVSLPLLPSRLTKGQCIHSSLHLPRARDSARK